MSVNNDLAIAIPTKQFFVSMLTRDITLADAILDLVDNCLDGALRSAGHKEVNYSEYVVKIELGDESFVIEDNCGGIPRNIAKNYAFKMGREPDDDRDPNDETIGMYGVGMKRAIFKMGRDAIVKTRYQEDSFEVSISSAWMENKDWDPLPIHDSNDETRLSTPGTRIEVSELHPSVSLHFQNVAFINDLKRSIGEHFTLFLQKGLHISVNEDKVRPVLVELLVSDKADGPAPYVFTKTIEGVSVSITVGLNTGRGASDNDTDTSDFERDRSAVTAGWTVFCNDRAIIVGDKSRLTGWGDRIPLYHYQFSVITGIVEFRSTHAEKLPVTTTKRALDTTSNIWLEALTKMREGLRIWIDYTNNWKNHPRSDQTKYWESATSMSLSKVIEEVSKRDMTKKSDGATEYNPVKKSVLPKPETMKPSSRRIVFSRPIEEIQYISKYFFDTEDEQPGIIGDKCFGLVLENISKQEVEA